MRKAKLSKGKELEGDKRSINEKKITVPQNYNWSCYYNNKDIIYIITNFLFCSTREPW